MDFDTLDLGAVPEELQVLCSLAILFSLSDDETCGHVQLVGHNDHGLIITIVHEHKDAPISTYTLFGDEMLMSVPVADGECFAIQARRSGTIVSSAILEVCTRLTDISEAVLLPRLTSNFLLSQHAITDEDQAEALELEMEAVL
jgi:hypothetical protein